MEVEMIEKYVNRGAGDEFKIPYKHCVISQK